MPRPRRGRVVFVGAADYRPSYLPRTDTRVTDVWPSSSTLATYRMDLDAFRRLYNSQGGKCAICQAGKEPFELRIDHNHKTGKVRGLLCSGCNTGLGLFKDSPDMLEVAMQYLEERGCYGPNALAEESA